MTNKVTAEQAITELAKIAGSVAQDNAPHMDYIAMLADKALSAPRVPDGWRHDCAGILSNDVELWIDACPHCGKPRPAASPETADSGSGAAMREASSLAMSIWKQHYKDVSPNFELCDSVVGILTQIDNMAAGLSEKIVERDAELARLREALDRIQAIADGYVSEGELPVMVVVQTICKQAMLAASPEPVARTVERDSGTLTVDADGSVSKIVPRGLKILKEIIK